MDATYVLVLGIVGAIVTQMGTVAIIMFNARQARLRREEQRRWDVEDRRELAAKVLATGDKLTAHVTQQTEGLAIQVERTEQAAHKAYKEANDVNLKIEHLNQRLLDETTPKP